MPLIKVTQKHINKGTKGDSYTCPVALAIREQLKLPCSVCVMFGWIRFGVDGLKWQTPKSVKRFMTTFDECKKNAKPFNFILKPYQE